MKTMLISFLLFAFSLINAQTDTVSISGNVIFPNNEPITSGIDIYLYNSINKLVDTTHSDSTGSFSFDLITGVENEEETSNISSLSAYVNSSDSRIIYQIPNSSDIEINIYNILGQLVKSFSLSNVTAGVHSVYWSGRNNNGNLISNGIYFLQINDNINVYTSKLLKVEGNLYNGSKTTQQLSTSSLSKITGETYTLHFVDTTGTVREKDVSVSHKENLSIILEEKITYSGNNIFNIKEGDTLKINLSLFQTKTGGITNTFLEDTTIFKSINTTASMLIYAKDKDYNGINKVIYFHVTAPKGTDSLFSISASFSPMTDITGKIVDNDSLYHGNGPATPGWIIYNNDSTYTPTGNFHIQTNPTTTTTLKARPTDKNGKTIGWTVTQTIPTNKDITNIILHPVTNKGIEGHEKEFIEVYKIADKPGSNGKNYYGKKYFQKGAEIWIRKTDNYGYTAPDAEQDSVENFIRTNYLPGMQTPFTIRKLTQNDTIPPSWHRRGIITIEIVGKGGNASGGTIDYESDGILDQGDVRFPKLGDKFIWPWLMQELFTVEAAPNEVPARQYQGLTVLDSANPYSTFQPFDPKYRRIGENFPPKEKLENILGNNPF